MTTRKTRYSFSELQEVAAKHGITVEPPPVPKPQRSKKPDPGVSELRKAIAAEQAKKTAETAASSAATEPARKRTHYVRDGGAEEFLAKKGEWVARDSKHWEQQSRFAGPGQVLMVHDVPGPTTTQHPTFGKVLQRGCLICGDRMVARPASPIRFGKWRGALCPTHHLLWESSTITDRGRLGLIVGRALYNAGRLSPDYPTIRGGFGVHPVQRGLKNWRTFTWGYRVLTADDPTVQEPGSEPWFFLKAGPVRTAQRVEPDEVST